MSLFKTARFKVKAERIEHVTALIREFLEHIRREEPGTLSYRCFQEMDNGACFVHLMEFADEAAEEAHSRSPNTVRFAAGLSPDTIGGVEFEDYREIAAARHG